MNPIKSEAELTIRGGKPMTNYNERLEEIFAKLPQYNLGQDPITDKDFTPDETFAIYPELAEAKQAITSLIKELVAEAQAEILIWATGGIKEFTEDGRIHIPAKISELTTNQEGEK